MLDGTDYARQTVTVNIIDDQSISEVRRIICYSQPIYDDLSLEYAGLTLGVRDSINTTVPTLVEPLYDQASIFILDNDSKRCV